MNNSAISWFEIYVNDIPRAKAFYEKVLNKKLTQIKNEDKLNDSPQPEMWAFSTGNQSGINGAICKMAGFKAGDNSTLVYFDSEDCAVEAARVEIAGGKVTLPKMSIGECGYISVAEDTEGNMIGFHSMG